jgi:heptosyltransferase-3
VQTLRTRLLGMSAWQGNVRGNLCSLNLIHCRPMQTLIYHAGALGDLITTLPAMEWWRREHPETLMVLAGKPELASLARQGGIVDEIWDVQSARWAALFNPDPAPADFSAFHRFSDAILFAADSSPLPQIMRQAGIERILRQAPFPAIPGPIIQYHLSLFGDKAVLTNPQDPFEHFRAEFLKEEKLMGEGEEEVMIHPGSGSAQKNWPFDSFCQLAALLKNDGQRVIWIAGPAERQCPYPALASAILKADLNELARRLSTAPLYIGNDSGVTHLAAAMGCPTIALFGPTDPNVWAPSGPRVRIIWAGHREISRDDPSIAKDKAGPMRMIGVEEVWHHCQNILAKGK